MEWMWVVRPTVSGSDPQCWSKYSKNWLFHGGSTNQPRIKYWNCWDDVRNSCE